MKLKSVSIIFFIMLTVGCKQNNSDNSLKNQKTSHPTAQNEKGQRFDWSFVHKVKNINGYTTEAGDVDHTIIIYSDGECSNCIIDIIDWIEKVRKLKNNKVALVLVGKGQDEYLLNYNFDKYGLKLGNQEYMLIDSSLALSKYNSFIDQNGGGAILIDRDSKVLVKGDPFIDKDVFDIYLKRGVFSK